MNNKLAVGSGVFDPITNVTCFLDSIDQFNRSIDQFNNLSTCIVMLIEIPRHRYYYYTLQQHDYTSEFHYI